MTSKLVNTTITIILFGVLCTGCASGYQNIAPKSTNYVSVSNKIPDVALSYKYDVLKKKYKKKEDKRGIRVVALRITNNSNEELTLGQNLNLSYSNSNPVVMIPTEIAFKELKQTTPTYLLYLLLTPLNLVTTESSNGFQQETSSIPVGLVVGPALAFGNMIAAGSANKKFKDEITNNELIGRKIKPGETVAGLMALRSGSYDALELSKK